MTTYTMRKRNFLKVQIILFLIFQEKILMALENS